MAGSNHSGIWIWESSIGIKYGLFGQLLEQKAKNPRHYELIDWGSLIPWDQYQHFLVFYLNDCLHDCFLDFANQVKFQPPRIHFRSAYGGKEFPNLAYSSKTEIFQSRGFPHRITARDAFQSPPSKWTFLDKSVMHHSCPNQRIYGEKSVPEPYWQAHPRMPKRYLSAAQHPY